MSDRAAIFERLRDGVTRTLAHPGAHPPPPIAEGVDAFSTALARAGGDAHGPTSTRDLPHHVERLVDSYDAGERTVAEPSAADWLGTGRWRTAGPNAAPHAFADTRVGIVRGRVGCAENGAVAVTGADAPDRALLVLCEHLVILLSAERIVPDLHRAFAALPDGALSDHHLTWISGPSKTADIEQSLVHGAHGPLTLDVVVVGR